MALKDNLKRIRKSKKISQQDLAKLSELSFSMVSKLESGEQSNPTLDTIEKISFALGVKPSDLIGTYEYFDMKYNPDGKIVKEDEEYFGFIGYLKSLGYTVKTELDEVISSYEQDEFDKDGNFVGKSTVIEEASYIWELSIDGKLLAVFKKEEFEEFRTTIKESVNYQIWKKNNT